MFSSCSQPIKANKIISCGTEILNIQSEQQQQRDDDLRSPLMSAVYANCLRTANLLFIASGTQDFQHSIRTAATERDDDLQSLLVSAVRLNCLRTADLLFVAYGTRDFEHSIRTAASKRRQLTTRQSPLVSDVRANCLRTAICPS